MINTKRNKRNSLGLAIDRMLSNSRWKQLVILFILFIGALAFSYIIYAFTGDGNYERPFYLLIDSNALSNFIYSPTNSGSANTMTSIIACLIYFIGIVVFSGMLISIISNVISRRVDNYQNGLTHYLKAGHIVILGYDDIIPSIIVDVCNKDRDVYVLLMSSVKTEIISEKLRRSAANEFKDRIILNYGHRTNIADLKEAHVESAERIYIVGNRTLPFHDAMNVECVQSICSYLKDSNSKQMPDSIVCVFENFDTYTAFQTTDIFKDMIPKGVSFIPYNFYTDWAKRMFVDKEYYSNHVRYAYPSLDGKGIRYEDDSYVHIIIVGTSTFGVSLAIEAAKVLHFPNFDRNNSLKTKITFIDIKADEEINLFRTRFHQYFEIQSCLYRDLSVSPEVSKPIPPTIFRGDDADFLDVSFEFIKGDVFADEIRQYLSSCANIQQEKLSIILAMSNQQDNFAIGMNMPEIIYEKGIPVFIRQDRSSAFVTNLREVCANKDILKYKVVNGKLSTQKIQGRYSNIYPFGMTDIGFEIDGPALRRAKLINFLYNTAFEGDHPTYSFMSMDNLNKCNVSDIFVKANEQWEKLSVALQWSNMYCAYNIPYRMNSLKAMRNGSDDLNEMTDDEINRLGVVEHNRWNMEKVLLGYRKPLPEEDAISNSHLLSKEEKKKLKGMKDTLYVHCDIRPFNGLNEIQKLDKEMVRYIPWIIRMSEEIDTINN